MIPLRKIAVAILLAGLSAAAMVLAIVPAEGDQEEAGTYVASIHNSKRQRGDLERIGGKAAVAAAEFNDWFDGLWQGRRLAGTLAVISIGISLLCVLASKTPPPDE